MKTKEMEKLIRHCDTYFAQDDCIVLHPIADNGLHIDVLLYKPNDKYNFWKTFDDDFEGKNCITMGISGSQTKDWHIVKDKLMKTKKGQRMTSYDKRAFLLPYEMTSRLMDEINNLKLKKIHIKGC